MRHSILRPQLPDGAPPDRRRKPRPELGPCSDRTGPYGTGPLCRRRIQQFAECSDTSIQKIRGQAPLLVADRRTGFDAKSAHLIDTGSLRPDGKSLYNPSWGYQDGKVRSGRIRREAVPLAAAAYRVRLTDATSLAATFTAETGIRRYSSLAWYDAPSPMPDYYRWMPGYQTDP